MNLLLSTTIELSISIYDDEQDLARQTQEDQENDDRTFGSYFRTIRCTNPYPSRLETTHACINAFACLLTKIVFNDPGCAGLNQEYKRDVTKYS